MSCGFVVSQYEMTWLTAAPRALAAAANAGSLGDGTGVCCSMVATSPRKLWLAPRVDVVMMSVPR
jgi:hypothetical protein